MDLFLPFLLFLPFYIRTFPKLFDRSYFPSLAEFWTYFFLFFLIWSLSKNVFKEDLSVSNLLRFCMPEDILNWLSHLNKNLIECIIIGPSVSLLFISLKILIHIFLHLCCYWEIWLTVFFLVLCRWSAIFLLKLVEFFLCFDILKFSCNVSRCGFCLT